MIDAGSLRNAFGSGAGVDDGEWPALAEALNRFPPPCARLRPDASDAARETLAESTPIAWHSRGRLLPAGTRPARSPFYAAGEWYVQDAGSLLADALLDVSPGETVLDLCSAPGGKSTAISERLGSTGALVANEPIAGRLDVLRFNLARHGGGRYVVTSLDPDDLARRYPDRFDAVLVDAPCSGQSLVVRGKQSLSSFGENAVALNAERQSRILDAAIRLVRPGGRLVYATCTFARQENEDQIERLVSRFPEWSVESLPELSPFESPLLSGTYRLMPHRWPTAGAFAARLRKSASGDEANNDADRRSRPPARKRERRTDRTSASHDSPQAALAEFASFDDLRFIPRGSSLFAYPPDFPDDFDESLVGGPEVVFLKGKTWFPAYAAALRRDGLLVPRATVPVEEDDAWRYLRGESFASAASGWAVVTYRGLPLGWCKADGRQAKNHLPKPGRLVGAPTLEDA